MSNTDSFIDEVSEEVRRDRLFKIYRKYAWVFVLLIVGIIGGTIYNEYAKSQARAQAEAAGAALQASLEAGDASLLNDLAASGDDAAVIAALQQASIQLDSGEQAAAAATLRGLADQLDLAAPYRDLALLKLVVIDGANMDEDELLNRLDRLTVPGAPYRMLGIEQRALHFVRKGEIDAALGELRLILDAAETTEALLRRAQELTIALGGSLDTATNG